MLGWLVPEGITWHKYNALHLTTHACLHAVDNPPILEQMEFRRGIPEIPDDSRQCVHRCHECRKCTECVPFDWTQFTTFWKSLWKENNPGRTEQVSLTQLLPKYVWTFTTLNTSSTLTSMCTYTPIHMVIYAMKTQKVVLWYKESLCNQWFMTKWHFTTSVSDAAVKIWPSYTSIVNNEKHQNTCSTEIKIGEHDAYSHDMRTSSLVNCLSFAMI